MFLHGVVWIGVQVGTLFQIGGGHLGDGIQKFPCGVVWRKEVEQVLANVSGRSQSGLQYKWYAVTDWQRTGWGWHPEVPLWGSVEKGSRVGFS